MEVVFITTHGPAMWSLALWDCCDLVPLILPLIFVFVVTASGSQGSLPSLHSGITPGGVQEPYGMPEIKSGSAMCKNPLHCTIALTPLSLLVELL